ncbi:hypothetical protein MMC17_000671 [Xylographa soralifera]|nr:hypothetical protein [Xylographa soralifera]
MAHPLQPIKVWGKGGPNPPKVAMILSELGIPYDAEAIPMPDLKKPAYLAINPNGRLPAIHDPNTGITLWESGAIVEYLIERYDTAHKLSFEPGTAEAYHAKQWLFFQASGQGPYYGQYGWYRLFAPEELPSALERYAKEVNRVTAVLEGHLSKQTEGEEWLVGGKCSYADIAFVSWQTTIAKVTKKEEYDEDNYPHVKAWIARMLEREGTRKGYETKQVLH